MAAAVDPIGDYEVTLLLDSTNISHGDQENNQTVEGVVDYRGEKVRIRSNFGGWRSASFIICAEIGETIAFYGIHANLISYLTGPLGQSTAAAATNINVWSGMVWLFPLLGAFVADSYLGRFRTILFSSLIYVLALGLLTLSLLLPSRIIPMKLPNSIQDKINSSSIRVIFFYFCLYLVAVSKGGFKPCAEAFGADQFDARNQEECSSKSSFFNWWYFGLCIGASISRLTLTYIQDNLSWALGFGIPCIFMLVALIVFVLGMKTYRYSVKEENADNPILKSAQVFIGAAKNYWRTPNSFSTTMQEEIGMSSARSRIRAHQFKFLDKALIDMSKDPTGLTKHDLKCSIDQVEDAKAVLRLVPIWTLCLMYAIVVSQSPTFFTKQGNTMERSIGLGIEIPAASLLTFISLSVIVFIPIYDRLLIPLARFFTGKSVGITMLQRIGCGMFISTISIVVAAVIEKKRLQIAQDFGLIDNPKETIPMSVWWLVPQYLLFGLAEVFTMVGLQELFYDQVPNGLRSVGLSLYFSIFGIGDFLSGFLIYAIDKVTSGSGQCSWFCDNLNRAHLDHFYWLLGGFSAINLVAYIYFSKTYLY